MPVSTQLSHISRHTDRHTKHHRVPRGATATTATALHKAVPCRGNRQRAAIEPLRRPPPPPRRARPPRRPALCASVPDEAVEAVSSTIVRHAAAGIADEVQHSLAVLRLAESGLRHPSLELRGGLCLPVPEGRGRTEDSEKSRKGSENAVEGQGKAGAYRPAQQSTSARICVAARAV